MYYYIFDSSGQCVARTGYSPDAHDLASRGDILVESSVDFPALDKIRLQEGQIVEVEATPEETARLRKAEILARLAAIDLASIRPLRAVADGNATSFDTGKLASLDAEAAELRAELAGLA
jgi:hypothetical protein